MLALKIAAASKRGIPTDWEDAAVLVKRFREKTAVDSSEELFDRIGGFIKVEYRHLGRYSLQEAWELADELK